MKHIVIIGNGIAGITAARYIRKLSDHAITVISAESTHFFSRTALMYVYMGHMQYEDIKPYEDFFWEKNRIHLLQAYVQKVDTEGQLLHTSMGKSLHYDELILATGSVFNKFNWPGQDLEGVGGLYSLQDLEYMETYTRDARRGVVVGGGLIGIEMAEMMCSRDIDVTLLVREASYWNNVLPPEESGMVSDHILEHHVDLRLGDELAEILPDDRGRVRAIVTKSGKTIECQWVGLTAGVSPNVKFLADSGIEIDRGILVDHHFRTNIPHVHAIGDCAQFREPLPGRGKLEQIWYTGKMHGETVAVNICGEARPYSPGVFFNSAKFFDIEYQTYGAIPAENPEHIGSFVWQEGQRLIRINYVRSDLRVTGFNLMGVRFRHEVCDVWLREGRKLPEVVQDLRAANFDPEFYKRFEKPLLEQYNREFPKHKVALRSRGKLLKMIFGSKRRPGPAVDLNATSPSKKQS